MTMLILMLTSCAIGLIGGLVIAYKNPALAAFVAQKLFGVK